jgi:hypothetical protein
MGGVILGGQRVVRAAARSSAELPLVVKTAANCSFTARRKLVMAVPVPVLYDVLHLKKKVAESRDTMLLKSTLDHYGTNSFLLLYALVDPARSGEFVRAFGGGYTVVGPPLQKIIPIGPTKKDEGEKRVFLVAYADGASARWLHERFESARKHRAKLSWLERTIRETTGVREVAIDDARAYYWQHGTHYFKPSTLGRLLYPSHDRMIFCGEAFSRHQGWTEGALASVVRQMRRLL